MKKNILILIAIVAIGILGRMLPHVWNTTPVLAAIIFASTYLGRKYSALTLILIMGVSDSLLGAYQWQVMASVYVSLFVSCFAGAIIRKHKNIITMIGMPILGSILFYIVTNWAVWQFSPLYSHTFQGLIDSYVMALPFFKNSLVGDIIYSALFFGLYEGSLAALRYLKTHRHMKEAQALIL